MAPSWSPTFKLRWFVLLALSIETTSLVFGPIKDLIIWKYPVTLFKPSLSYSSQIIDEDFRSIVENVTLLNSLGRSVIEIEFPNINFGAELATYMGYDYNAENLWSVDVSLNNTNVQPTPMSALSQDVLGRIEAIVSSSDMTTRTKFYEACAVQLDTLRAGESHCWYADNRATTDIKELLLYMVNQLNAHPAGIVFGSVKENAVSGSNIAGKIKSPDGAKFDFSLFYGGQALGFGDAHVSEGIARFFTSDLLPAVSNSIEAYLCLSDQNLDDVFFNLVASDAALPLNRYLYEKHAADPEYLSKLFLPEYQAALQVCRTKDTLQKRLTWLMESGSLMNIWPRVTFDYVAEVLVNTLEAITTLTKAETGQMRTTKYTYPGEPFIYADKRAKYNIFGDKSLQINSTKKVVFTTYKASKTFPWRRHLLSEWYYQGLDRAVVTSADEADYFAHDPADRTYTNANGDEIQTHKVKHYSWTTAAAFTGCHPIKVADCSQLPDLNNASRWYLDTYGGWDEVKLPTPTQPLSQLYTTVTSFEEFILTLRAVMSYPMVAIDIDNSMARPVAETTYWRNYVMADMGGMMDGALPFLTELSLKMGQLESDISMMRAKEMYVQRFFNPIYNVLSIGRGLWARSRKMVIPLMPYPVELTSNYKIPFVNIGNDVLCAWDRLHSTTPMFMRGRDHNGMCSQVKGPVTGDRTKYDLMQAPFYNTSIPSTPWEEGLAQALREYVATFERVSNTNVTRTPMQTAIASTYPAFRLAPGIGHRVNSWRFFAVFYGRGETHHIPSNFFHLYTNAGLKYTSQGFYMDYSMEGAYKILTFVAILTSFATAFYTVTTVVIPTLLSVSRAPNAVVVKADIGALFSMDLACASYSSSILLPFNVLSGLIPVMEILVHLDTDDFTHARQAASIVAAFLCSWRFGVAVLSIATDMTLPGRISWGLTAVVTALFYATIHIGLASQLEIYSRALVVVFVDFIICAIAVYPVLRWYKGRHASVITNSSINALVNMDVIFIAKAGLVFTGDLDGEEAAEMEAYIASKHGRDVVITKKSGAAIKEARLQEAAGGKPVDAKAYKLATPSLTHALESAARHKTAIWVNFETRQVRPWNWSINSFTDKDKNGSEVRPSTQSDGGVAKHKAFSPLAIV